MGDLTEIKPECNERVIKILEGVLAGAKAGRYQGVAMVMMTDTGGGADNFECSRDPLKMLGLVRVLERNIIESTLVIGSRGG